MSRILFDYPGPEVTVDPGRADIACFVGLTGVLNGAALSADVQNWLSTLGYADSRIRAIEQVPVPVDSYAGFTSIFDPGTTSTSTPGTLDYLAAAVRSFFAQGGKRCYVVRASDPVAVGDSPQSRAEKLLKLLPDDTYAPGDPRNWTGVGAISSLPEISFLAIPDLPVLLASVPAPSLGEDPVTPGGPEQFVVCSKRDVTPPQKRVNPNPAPRLAPSDYTNWANAVAAILNYLASGSERHEFHLREVQFVAAFPLPQEIDPGSFVGCSTTSPAQVVHDVIAVQMPELLEPFGNVPQGNISSSFLQLAYPWLKTSGSYILPEGLEPPDGALIGILARNALTRGTFTSATKITPSEVFDVWPVLPAQETRVPSTSILWDNRSPKPLITRFSLFGFTPGGVRLISDVTAYPRESYRPACVNRLVSVILRAARHLGEDVIFDVNGPALWGRIETFLQQLMTRLWALNALEGTLDMSPGSTTGAFSVRCDRSTMTQNDIDNGRAVAEVSFRAAATLDLIRVTLALESSGANAQETTASQEVA